MSEPITVDSVDTKIDLMKKLLSSIIDDMGLNFPRYRWRGSNIYNYIFLIKSVEYELSIEASKEYLIKLFKESEKCKEDLLDLIENLETKLFLNVCTRQGYCWEDVDYNEIIRENNNYIMDYQHDLEDTYRTFIFTIPEELIQKYNLKQ